MIKGNIDNSRYVSNNSYSSDRFVSNSSGSRSPVVRFSHSMDKPIIVNNVVNNRRQSIKVNFLNNSIIPQSIHYPKRSFINNNITNSNINNIIGNSNITYTNTPSLMQ